MSLNKKSFFLLVAAAAALVQRDCSMGPLSGVETTNGKIIALVHTREGTPAVCTKVCLAPVTYSPVHDSALHVAVWNTTDNNGRCEFTVSRAGSYNLFAVDSTSHTGFFHHAIAVDVSDSKTIDDTLKDAGRIAIVLSDQVDTITGFVVIRGVPVCRNFAGQSTSMPNGDKVVLLNDMPASPAYEVYYGRHVLRDSIVARDTIAVVPNRVTDISIFNSTIKPLWKIRILAGVTDLTLQYYNNNLDSIKKLIALQMVDVNRGFNITAEFNGCFSFFVDSVYSFSTTPVTAEFKAPPMGYAFRFLYNAYPDYRSLAGWNAAGLTVYHSVDVRLGEALFCDKATRDLLWAFSEARGCVFLACLAVDSLKNQINHKAYVVEPSVLNDVHACQQWDLYNRNIINYNADTAVIANQIYTRAVPGSIGLKTAAGASGAPLPGTAIKVYKVEWSSGAVVPPAIDSGLTNTNGEYVFSDNPFKPGGSNDIVYPNFLIIAIRQTDTVYTWLPLTEVGNAWFANPAAPFRKTITF